MRTELTSPQATDLAHYFLGPNWCSYQQGTFGPCCIAGPSGVFHIAAGWRAVFRLAGVKLPCRPRYVAIGRRVIFSGKTISSWHSNSLALKESKRLNRTIQSQANLAELS
jgi:hypothetical protein